MRVLLAQLDPAPRDLDANAEAVAAALAAQPEAELAVFPELFLSGYETEEVGALALDPAADGTPLAAVRAAAAQHGTAVVIGFPERTAEGGVANAVACIERDGTLAGVYRKTHLFGGEERAAFARGEALLVVRLAGRRVGPLNCFDVEFPEPARALAKAGAELLVTVAANMEPYGPDHALAARARALDNRLPHVYVNRVGDESGLHFVGGSAAIAAGGRAVAELGDAAGARLVELQLGSGDDEAVNYLEHLRDDLPVQGVSSTSVHGGTR